MFKQIKLKNLFIIILLLLTFLNPAMSQEEELERLLGEAGKHLYTNMDSALFYLNQISKTTKDTKNWASYLSANLWKINCAGRHYRFDSLYVYLTDSEEVILDNNIDLDTLAYGAETRMALNTNWGNYYYKTGEFDKASTYFKKIINELSETDTLGTYEYKTLISNHVFLGNIARGKSDYKGAIDEFLHCEQLNKRMMDEVGENYANTIISSSLASVYKLKGDLEKARFQHKKAIRLTNEKLQKDKRLLGKLKNSLITHYNQFARLYLDENNPAEARKLIEKSLQYHIKNDPFYPKTKILLGKTFALEGNTDQALNYIDEAVELTRKRYGERHYRVAEDLLEKGEVLAGNAAYGKALAVYQKALYCLVDEYDTTKIFDAPKLNTINKKVLLLALNAKINALVGHHEKHRNIEYLQAAATHTTTAVGVMDQMRKEYHSEESRQFLIEQSYPIFEQALAIQYQLYQQDKDKTHLEKAFYLAEKSKSLLLLDALQSSTARQFSNIPEETLEQERLLRFNINSLKERIGKLKKEAKNETKLTALQEELFEQNSIYQNFIAELEQQYPDYYQLKYDLRTVDINDVRKELINEQTALIEYFAGDERVYIFSITNNDIQLHTSPKIDEIDTAIADLRQAITDRTDIAYTNNAHQLYKDLLQQALNNTPAAIQRLIVIPDGGLAYIPFDILLSKPVLAEGGSINFRPDLMPYLLHQYSISYAYSATVLQQNLKSKGSGKAKFAFGGFAPSFDHVSDLGLAMRSCQTGRLSKLKYNKEEVEAIAKTMKGKAFIDEEADKKRFLSDAGQCRILHLATHACADDDASLSRVYFSEDDYISVQELYGVDLNAEMVVLSACETGVGTLKRGEGVMSLARAFAYTGVPGITMSLWSIDDQAASSIMVNYYKHLNEKQGKDEALRIAKLDFLKNLEEKRYQHPFYWAAFVHIGDAEPITQPNNWWMFVMAAIFGFVMLFLWTRRKRIL